MSKFYSLSIDDDFVSLLYVDSNSKGFSILQEEVLELSELETFIDAKQDVYISCDQEYIIDDLVAVPSVIKNKSTVRNYILHQLKKADPQKQILFNYRELPKQKDEENVTYHVDGVDEVEFSKSLEMVKDWEKIKSATLSKFSLLALSNQCIKEKAYISVYTSGKKILILAIADKEILFSRSNVISSPTAESLQLDMTAEINQTISYIQQQYRDTQFSTIVLSGQMAIDDRIAEQLLMLNTLPICILYPNYLVKNIEAEVGHSHILTIGNLFVPKEHQFFPTALLGLKQFTFTTNLLLALSTIILLVVSYFTFDEYLRYSDLLEQYHTIKDRLLNTVRHTKTLSQEDLEKSLNHLNIAKKHLKNHPSDTVIELKPLISLQKPSAWEWSHENDVLNLSAKFEKPFKTLGGLHEFELEFDSRLDDINGSDNFMKLPNTNYKKLYFTTEVKMVPKTQNRDVSAPQARVE